MRAAPDDASVDCGIVIGTNTNEGDAIAGRDTGVHHAHNAERVRTVVRDIKVLPRRIGYVPPGSDDPNAGSAPANASGTTQGRQHATPRGPDVGKWELGARMPTSKPVKGTKRPTGVSWSRFRQASTEQGCGRRSARPEFTRIALSPMLTARGQVMATNAAHHRRNCRYNQL